MFVSTITLDFSLKCTGRCASVEVGSNTSTVALLVVGGDEKGTQCIGV
jgi:hypothetical protein